jgi:hypothetical protein
MAKKVLEKTVYKSALTGRFVSSNYAESHPETTFKASVLKKEKPSVSKKAVKRRPVKKVVKRHAVKKAVKRRAVKKAVKRRAVKRAVVRRAVKKAIIGHSVKRAFAPRSSGGTIGGGAMKN